MRRSLILAAYGALPLFALLAGVSCEEDVSGVDDRSAPWFEVSAVVDDGIAPDTVTIVGTLHGDIDTLVMCARNVYSLCIDWPPKGCIWYRPPCDSTERARRTYAAKVFYESPGRHRAVMFLHCGNLAIEPDTVYVNLE